MKKWLVAILGIFLVASGCTGNSNPTSNTAPQSLTSNTGSFKPAPNTVDAAFEGFEAELDREYSSSMNDTDLVNIITNTDEANVPNEGGLQ